MKTTRQYEETLCIAAFAMVERLRPINCKIIHIPNGGARGKDKISSAIIGRQIKAMGALAGIPDYIVLFEDGTYTFVEMKLALKKLRDIVIHKKTYLNPAQKEFKADMTALCGQNFRFAVTRSVDEFIDTLTEMGVQWKFRRAKGIARQKRGVA